ncbi:MAG TPA: Hsp20/alpha crystallin family protein [Rhodanobacteraceae bacterium]|nr:Hsp20/alpha crystallin family protein [Rhodanobacteraceae bacterium]
MSVSHLIPWNRNRLSHLSREVRDPLLTLHREMNRLFDDFIGQFDLSSVAEGIDTTIAAWPHVELNDTEKDIVLTAELPGMSEKDVDVVFTDQALIIRGERRAERQEADQQISERYYGRFERRIPLDAEVEPDKAKAEFRNGVLTVTLPKSAQAQKKLLHIPVGRAA